MTGDVIYCMGGWADLVHEAQFIHSNKWGSIWTLMSTGKLIWCRVFWELFFSDYFCFLNEMEVMSSTKSKYQRGHGRCLIREDKMWTRWDRVRKNRGELWTICLFWWDVQLGWQPDFPKQLNSADLWATKWSFVALGSCWLEWDLNQWPVSEKCYLLLPGACVV